MSQVSATNVFDFLGTTTEGRSAHSTNVTASILKVIKEIEGMIGRRIESLTVTNILFSPGVNCDIHENKLYLKGPYRDIYSISAISEMGNTLTVVADYNDGNGYSLDSRLGIITRNLANWSQAPYAIKITGKAGLCDSSDDTIPFFKQAIIEMTAAKSGLWKNTVMTDGGEIQTTRTTISPEMKKQILKYKQVVV